MDWELSPAVVETLATGPSDSRVGHLLRPTTLIEIQPSTSAAILGFPCDQGVRINGGRVGAADGPDEIRHWLYRMTPDAGNAAGHAELLARCVDLGNLRCHQDLATNQRNLGVVVGSLLQRGITPIILGGGHETSYGHFLGYVEAATRCSILNVDAHPDVRPLIDGQGHSGSPFRQALESVDGCCRHYGVVGLSRHAVAAEHLDYLTTQGGDFVFGEGLDAAGLEQAMQQADGPLMVTMDMDALDQNHAPGVSAPNAHGLSASFWLDAAHRFGRRPQVSSFDLVECNPRLDVDSATARLAALTIWRFTLGLAER